MYPRTATFDQAVRTSQTAEFRVDAYRGGVKLNDRPLPLRGGQVTVDGNSKVRRQLDLTLAPRHRDSDDIGDVGDVWDMLTPYGTELRVFRGIRYPSQQAEMIPLGVFGVDEQSLDLDVTRNVTIKAPDRWAVVQRARFLKPAASVRGALVRNEIARLIAGARPGLPPAVVTATSNAVLRPTVWDRDRDVAIEELCAAIGAEAFFDPNGVPIVRDVPSLSSTPPAWLVNAGATAVLLPGGQRTRNRARTYNTVVVVPAQIDGVTPFPRVVVADADPTSPTYVGSPPAYVPFFLTSPTIVDGAQAEQAAVAKLDKVRGLAAQLTLNCAPHPCLDAGDVIDALFARDPFSDVWVAERHIIDTVTVPLTVAGEQQIAGRSTRPDEPAEEASP